MSDNQQYAKEYDELIDRRTAPEVADTIIDLYQSGFLSPEDLDERAIDIINSVTVDQAKFIFKEIKDSKLFGVVNKCLYVTSLIRSFKDRVRVHGAANVLAQKLIQGPDPAAMEKILAETNYPVEVTIGQRKYGGPCPDWDGPVTGPAGQGHEIYVGHIPTEIFEDVLIPLFEKSGKIWDLRLMMDPLSGLSRGYAFVTYCKKEDAAAAAKLYDGHEITTGKPLKVNVSIANTRLFLGNIPKTKSKDEILEELKTHAEGVKDVIIYEIPTNDQGFKSRGFCFVDFVDHDSASAAKTKIEKHEIRPFDVDIHVDWSERQEKPDMFQVKVMYISNINETVTEEKLNDIFKEYGGIERVHKNDNYAFVHFHKREDCLKAIEDWNGRELEGSVVECSIAKPPQLREPVDDSDDSDELEDWEVPEMEEAESEDLTTGEPPAEKMPRLE